MVEEHRPWWPRMRSLFSPFVLSMRWPKQLGYSDRIEIEQEEEEPESETPAEPTTEKTDRK